MPDSRDDLQTLWDELNQPDDTRQQQALNERLKQRAGQYAAPERDDAPLSAAEAVDVLVFSLEPERYALPVAVVRGVRPVGNLTRVPGVPDFYRGVVNARGTILSVLDLRRFFGLSVATDDIPGELIHVEAEGLYLALLAHHIEDVQTLPRRRIQHIELPYAQGVTPERLVLLDPQTIFSDERLLTGGDSSS